MDWINVVLSIMTLVAGGGWFVCYRAYKKRNEGEATQAEAGGWAAQQDVYQQTVADLRQSCDYIKEERDRMRDENRELREENSELRAKHHDHEELIMKLRKEYTQQIIDLRKEISRLGRKLESIIPFACGVAACQRRTRVEIRQTDEDGDENDNVIEE